MFKMNYPNVTQIIIPRNVTATNSNFDSAFMGSTNLTDVKIANKATDLSYAFDGCAKMVDAVCGREVTSMYGAYNNCSSLRNAKCGNNVTDMSYAYYNCTNLTKAACGRNVTSLSYAYFNCNKLTTPVCGSRVENMFYAYTNCSNLTTAVCGPKVLTMYSTYSDCNKITTPVCGINVTNLAYTYQSCYNLTTAVCGDSVVDFRGCYMDCNKIKTPVCGNNVVNMYWTYQNCSSLTTAVCGPNVKDMYRAYNNCDQISNAYLHSSKVSSVSGCFADRNNSIMLNIYVPKNSTTLNTCLNTGMSSICFNNVSWTNDTANSRYYNTYYNIYIYPVDNVAVMQNRGYSIIEYTTTNTSRYPRITGLTSGYTVEKSGSTVILIKNNQSDSVSMVNFYGDINLTGVTHLTDSITNMSNSFTNCSNLRGSAWCGVKVTDMYKSYYGCYNITSAACGNNVINMYQTYYNCRNLTTAACGNNVINMYQTYYNCRNLTTAVCGNKVLDFSFAYDNCVKLTTPVCGINVINIAYTYRNCRNIQGATYILSPYIVVGTACFMNKNNSKKLDIYVESNSTTFNTFMQNSASFSIVGNTINWSSSGNIYYNTQYNIFIHPVTNIINKYESSQYLMIFNTTNTSSLPAFYITGGYTSIINGNTVKLKKNIASDVATTIALSNDPYITSISHITDTIEVMDTAFKNCTNLTGSAWCGPNVYNMDYAYQNCYNLTAADCGPNVVSMDYAYEKCYNLTTAVCGDRVSQMEKAYYGCYNLTTAVCGNNVQHMGNTYAGCNKLTTAVCGPNVTNFYRAYYGDENIQGDAYIYSPYITNATSCFEYRNYSRMLNIYVLNNSTTLNTFLGNKIDNSITGWSMTWTYNSYGFYYNAMRNIRIYPVTNVYDEANSSTKIITYTTTNTNSYPDVFELTNGYSVRKNGNEVSLFKNSASDMLTGVFFDYNPYITGISYISNEITNMSYTFQNCPNLIIPACGNSVANMSYTFEDCTSLTTAVCGPSVTNMRGTFSGCSNVAGGVVFESPNVTNAYECFYGRGNSARLSIYVQNNSTTLNTCLRTGMNNSITGTNITWTFNSPYNIYYNTQYNIYIYVL